MAKKNVQNSGKRISTRDQPAFLPDAKAVDPNLASLFSSSLGPGQALSRFALETAVSDARSRNEITTSSSDLDVEEYSKTSGSNSEDFSSLAQSEGKDESKDAAAVSRSLNSGDVIKQGRKRKHNDAQDDLESTYMRRLAREEALEEENRQAGRSHKRQRLVQDAHADISDPEPYEDRQEVDPVESHGDVGDESLQHESLQPSNEALELEKSSRTVFLANVSTSAIKSKTSKKILLDHLSSFIPSLPKDKVPHKVESFRFRSTAFSSTAVPKKAAFAKKELMDATTRSTNAYVVYSTAPAAREASKRLNGTIVLDRHLRVDGVAHPARTDHRRCVFVGNLGFVDDESSLKAAEDEESGRKPRKTKQAADAEEGLWRQFSKAGTVESVRVVRDKSTRVGKGIAYVQYVDPNAVEAALLFNDKKFPPLLPRKLRVTRAKSIRKTSSYSTNTKPSARALSKDAPNQIYNPKATSEARSLQGRAGKLLGQAGAAQLTSKHRHNWEGSKNTGGQLRTPESIVFEGYRASIKHGKGGVKMKSSVKKQGKPKTRSSKRGAAYKASGGRK
ncbi:MAG: Nucleolar protein 12, partial [Pleopsidium flavum]